MTRLTLIVLCLGFFDGDLFIQGQSTTPEPAEIKALHEQIAATHSTPKKDHEQIIPYWTSEGGWHTELQLRNNLSNEVLVVVPSIRTSDGKETGLNAIELLPREVKSIQLNDAITQVNSNLLSQGNAYGSVALKYTSKSLSNLFASVMIHDTGHPIMYHLDASFQIPKMQTGSREGIWWLPTKNTRDYLLITNQSDKIQQGVLQVTDSAGRVWQQHEDLAPRQTLRLEVRQLVNQAKFSSTYGGITFAMDAGFGSIDTVHILFDEISGFSATMKMFERDPGASITTHDFANRNLWVMRAPMLALTQPDPVLALPQDTKLHPRLFVRNTAKHSLKYTARFHWRGPSSDGRVPGIEANLSSGETREIDVQKLQVDGLIPSNANWTQISIETDSLPDELIAVAASYDEGLRYGAQTPFSDQLSPHLAPTAGQ